MFGVCDVYQTTKLGIWNSGEGSGLDIYVRQNMDNSRVPGLGESLREWMWKTQSKTVESLLALRAYVGYQQVLEEVFVV